MTSIAPCGQQKGWFSWGFRRRLWVHEEGRMSWKILLQTLGTGGTERIYLCPLKLKHRPGLTNKWKTWQLILCVKKILWNWKIHLPVLTNCIFLLYLPVCSVPISPSIFLLQPVGSHKCSRVPNLCGLNNFKCGSYPKQICIEWFCKATKPLYSGIVRPWNILKI